MSRETESDQPHVLMTAGRDWVPDPASVSAVVSALDSAPWVHLTDASTLLAGDAPTGRATAPESASDPAELAPDAVRALAAARDQAVAFATVTDDPEQLLEGVDAEVVAPLAVAWRSEPQARADLVARVLADLSALTSGLSIGRVSDVNVINSTGEIRLTVTNDLAVPVDVQLTVQPAKPCLEAEPVPTVSVDAKSSAVVPVTLHANANCEVSVVARLTSARRDPGLPARGLHGAGDADHRERRNHRRRHPAGHRARARHRPHHPAWSERAARQPRRRREAPCAGTGRRRGRAVLVGRPSPSCPSFIVRADSMQGICRSAS